MTAVRAVLAGVATAIVLLGVSVALFFNPIWIGFEQESAGVPDITGWTSEQVEAVTGSLLFDLFIGPPAFSASVDGRPVLDAAERSHMVDVRNVLLPAVLVAGAAAAVLIILLAVSRHDAWLWRAIALGSGALTFVGAVVGAAVVFFFDAAFLLFHRVFFPQGNFTFDARTERLTQLFPDQFWTETALAISVIGLLTAAVVTVVAWRRADRLRTDAQAVDG